MAVYRWNWRVFVWLVAVVGSAPEVAQAINEGLAGSRWAIVEVYGEPLAPDETPHVAFDASGRLSGRTACNWFHGSYSVEAGALVLLTRLTTLRGCLIDGKRRRDATLEALDSTQAFSIAGRNLILSDGGGEPVARLERIGDE